MEKLQALILKYKLRFSIVGTALFLAVVYFAGNGAGGIDLRMMIAVNMFLTAAYFVKSKTIKYVSLSAVFVSDLYFFYICTHLLTSGDWGGIPYALYIFAVPLLGFIVYSVSSVVRMIIRATKKNKNTQVNENEEIKEPEEAKETEDPDTRATLTMQLFASLIITAVFSLVLFILFSKKASADSFSMIMLLPIQFFFATLFMDLKSTVRYASLFSSISFCVLSFLFVKIENLAAAFIYPIILTVLYSILLIPILIERKLKK